MKRLRFALSLITGDNDYQRRQASAAQEAAARLGVDIRIIFANNNVIDQSQQLIDAIHAVERVEVARGLTPYTSTQENAWLVLASRALAKETLNLDIDGVPVKTVQTPNGPLTIAMRDTFLISPAGKIVKEWEVKDIDNHSDEVQAAIKADGK